MRDTTEDLMNKFKKTLSDSNLDPETLSLFHSVPYFIFKVSDHRGDCTSIYPLSYEVFIEKGAVYYEILIKMYGTYDFSVWINRYTGVQQLNPLDCDHCESIAYNLCIRFPGSLLDIIQKYFPYPLYIF